MDKNLKTVAYSQSSSLCKVLLKNMCEVLNSLLSSVILPHFEAALYFYPGDHAEINCQTSLTPPCHLIIACNTQECWQCWAIDSWHSLKHLIIFSHKPLSDLSTSLYCLWKKLHIKISELCTWSQSCAYTWTIKRKI